jgi:hypothetical protein
VPGLVDHSTRADHQSILDQRCGGSAATLELGRAASPGRRISPLRFQEGPHSGDGRGQGSEMRPGDGEWKRWPKLLNGMVFGAWRKRVRVWIDAVKRGGARSPFL